MVVHSLLVHTHQGHEAQVADGVPGDAHCQPFVVYFGGDRLWRLRITVKDNKYGDCFTWPLSLQRWYAKLRLVCVDHSHALT